MEEVVVWDSPETPVDTQWVYTWNGYAESRHTFSLLKYVENNDDRFRRRYLAWIHELGETRIGNSKLVDQLALEQGFSIWWMSLFAEKSPWKQPVLMDALRVFALNEKLLEDKPTRLRFISNNRDLHIVLKGLCRKLNICYSWQQLRNNDSSIFKKLYTIIPYGVRAFASLGRYAQQRWPLRRVESHKWFSGDNAVFFCSYFFHLNPEQLKAGLFYSKYWEGVQDIVHQLGLSANWLQLYYPHAAIPDATTALDKVNHFNQNRETQQGFHLFLDSFLSWSVLLRVAGKFIKLSLRSFSLGEVRHAFVPANTDFSLWPLMEKDWFDSVRGPVAINNLLFMELFNLALKQLPYQKKGFFLYENQNWERPFIHYWHKHGHGKLIAVAHSTVRYWDLRYFFDERTINIPTSFPLPQGDLIAVNGKVANRALTETGYPAEKIIETEAQRYVELGRLAVSKRKNIQDSNHINLLVLGDYMPDGTIKMLVMLEKAMEVLKRRVSITFKPHPNFMVAPEKFPSLNFKVTTRPLTEILADFDVAYTSNMTSAVVDAYIAQLPVIVMLDETGLNFSPLRGNTGIHFVSAAPELVKVLSEDNSEISEREELFFMDTALPKWRKLLEDESAEQTNSQNKK